jgi:hypothetical protein
MNRPEQDIDFDSALPGIQDVLARKAGDLDVAVEALQDLQARIPPPSPRELAWMRSGARPLSRAAYMLGRLQRAMVVVENVAADLRADADTAAVDLPDAGDLGEADFNAIQAAADRRSR